MHSGLTMLSQPGMLSNPNLCASLGLGAILPPETAPQWYTETAPAAIAALPAATAKTMSGHPALAPSAATLQNIRATANAPTVELPSAALVREEEAAWKNLDATIEQVFGPSSRAASAAHASAQAFIHGAPGKLQGFVADHHLGLLALTAATLLVGCNLDLKPETVAKMPEMLKDALIYKAFGGLGIFFLGLKVMDDGLKSASQGKLRALLMKLTSNRWAGLATGTVITGGVQSSSVVTVMTLGLVAAGLMSLQQALPVIFGSNIGTTITIWILSLKVEQYALPAIGLGAILHMFLNKNPKVDNIGKAVLGIGLVFLGLHTMAAGFKDPVANEVLRAIFSTMSGQDLFGRLMCVFSSASLTAIIQSSSATSVIIVALAAAGVLPFETAVPLIIGANIGTTITAFIASKRPGTPIEAKRVATSHAMFNILGAAIIFPFLPSYTDFINLVGDSGAMRFLFDHAHIDHINGKVSLSHTFFNLAAAIIATSLAGPYLKAVKWFTPDREAVDEKDYLNALRPQILKNDPVLALEAGRKVLEGASGTAEEMMNLLKSALTETNYDTVLAKASEGKRLEALLDRVQKKMGKWTVHLETKGYGLGASKAINAQQSIVRELESIGDSVHYMLDKIAELRGQPGFTMTEEMSSRLVAVHNQVLGYLLPLHEAIQQSDPMHSTKAGWKDARKERRRLIELIEEQRDAVVEGLLAANGKHEKNASGADDGVEAVEDRLAANGNRGTGANETEEEVEAKESTTAELATQFSDIFRSYRDIVMAVENIAKALAGKKY